MNIFIYLWVNSSICENYIELMIDVCWAIGDFRDREKNKTYFLGKIFLKMKIDWNWSEVFTIK